ncbi:FapA family protein [Vibrio makurazakiensis]|uniref:DUF342 domain-containing protein n=1 Tax=Vibrio makurazakiensis TaxID=2910250 RepID=UPI003D1458D8
MWDSIITLSEDKQEVIAKLPPELVVEQSFDQVGLAEAIVEIDAEDYFLDEEEVLRFVTLAREGRGEAYSGISIAEVRNATAKVEVSTDEMLASIVVTGAYKGRGLRGSEIVHCLAQAHISKGINKLALKKVMVMSNQLKKGEKFTQAVAKGLPAAKGKDAQFIPLVEDVTKRILKPQDDDSDKIDMRNLGETITVDENSEVMRRVPATKGKPGFTVQGRVIPPLPGKDSLLKAGKGTHISPTDPNLLLATSSGMPLIKEKTIEVDHALYLNSVGVGTGHVKFKGNVVVSGDIEPGMVVKASGTVTVGGFIESAEVQAQGDIHVGKGIIGHTVSEGQPKSCRVFTKGEITASYAQFSELQAGHDIKLSVHSMNNELRCGHDLIVMDAAKRHGTLSGGESKVGGKVTCVFLGVEGDTATKVHAFAKYEGYKQKITELKEKYTEAQEATMDVIRKELEFKKKPKAERSEEEQHLIESMKTKNNQVLESTKSQLEVVEAEFEEGLQLNMIEATEKVFTRVTVQFGDEVVTTKRTHGPSIFSYDQYKIECASKMEEEDIQL